MVLVILISRIIKWVCKSESFRDGSPWENGVQDPFEFYIKSSYSSHSCFIQFPSGQEGLCSSVATRNMAQPRGQREPTPADNTFRHAWGEQTDNRLASPELADGYARGLITGLETQHNRRLTELEAYRTNNDNRLVGVDNFRQRVGGEVRTLTNRVDQLDTFKTNEFDTWKTTVDTLVNQVDAFRTQLTPWRTAVNTRINDLDHFKDQLTPWKSDVDKRLNDFDGFKKDEFKPWKTSVDNDLANLGENKLNISEFVKARKEIEVRFELVETFESKMTAAWKNNIPDMNNRLNKLEKDVAGFEEKTNKTNADVGKLKDDVEKGNGELKKVIKEMDKKQEECCKTVKTMIKGLNDKIDDIGKGKDRDHESGARPHIFSNTLGPNTNWENVNHRSPGGVNIRVNNRGDITFNTGQLASHSPFPQSQNISHAPNPDADPLLPSLPSSIIYPVPVVITGRGRSSLPDLGHRSGSRSRDRMRYLIDRESGSNSKKWNEGLGIHLGLTRSTPGGLFKKSGKESYSFSLGGGGGGGRIEGMCD